jgi:hypothetical protein
MKRIWTYLLSGALIVVMAVPAMARERGREHERSRDIRHEDRDSRYRDYRRAKWNDHDRDDRRKGWEHGKKTGWHGDNMPPGQAKKHNDRDRDDWARERRHRRHHRVSYRRDEHRPVVRPATRPSYPTQQPMRHATVENRGTTTVADKPSGHVTATR